MKLAPLLTLLLLFGSFARAEDPVEERTRLYTAPDAASPGGLKGRIAKPSAPIEQIIATPAADPEQVYLGEVSGPNKDSFVFKGLPAGKYDVLVAFENDFYEGLQLDRDPSTLTPDDLTKIKASVEKSEPYFTKRNVLRLAGQTGRGNMARAICMYVREKGSDLLMKAYKGQFHRDDYRRTFKIVMFKDVGPGWQITRARDLYPIWYDPKRPLPTHHFSTALSEFRVADELKDVGDLDLSH